MNPPRHDAPGRARRPRVVWDMTFAAKSLTGTRVHTASLFDAIAALGTCDLVRVSVHETMRPEKTGNLLTGMRNLWWLYAELPKRVAAAHAELVHAAAYLGPPRSPCPFVVNIMDTTFLEYPEDFDWKWRLYTRLLIPPTVKRAAAIITPSEHSRRELSRAFPASAAAIRVIYHGVGSEFQSNPDARATSALRSRYALENNYVLHVGAQEPRKNLPAIISAFATIANGHPQLQLVLAGPRGKDSEAVQRTIRAHGLEVRVRDLGFVPKADLPGLYAAAQAFVFASRLEGFGMPLLEAMASGTPVIVAPNPPLPEVVGDAALITADASPAGLARGIAAVLDNPELAADLRCRGLEHARQFTWEKAATATVRVYLDLLDEHRAIAPA